VFLANLPLNRHKSSCMLLSQGGQLCRVAKPGVELSTVSPNLTHTGGSAQHPSESTLSIDQSLKTTLLHTKQACSGGDSTETYLSGKRWEATRLYATFLQRRRESHSVLFALQPQPDCIGKMRINFNQCAVRD
jgi:hypothetical protein